MVVAYELKKTVREIGDMTLQELNDWLAFFNVYNRKLEKEASKQRRRK